ncbi:MAG: peptidase M48 Ste24p [Planctomycetota bacterium]|nr:MAG: peptidase M48 Ste24p [Planctomycetota bacterium]
MRLPSPFPQTYRRSYGPSQALFGRTRRGVGSGLKARLILALVFVAFAVISYYGQPGDVNQVTGEVERVALAEEAQEIQLGLQAAGEMVQMHGGASRDVVGQQRVQNVGAELLKALDRRLAADGRQNPYRDAFRFTLLADPQTVNAFALPGGPVFITEALYRRLRTDGQLAGVLGHEIGHVLSRHSNKQMARQGLFQGIAGAVGVLGGDMSSAQMGQMIGAVLSTRYGRGAELESDKWGVRLAVMAGYDPRAMIEVMKILEEASGGGGQPEFLSTHPKPANRIAYIEQVIEEVTAAQFPEGLPPDLRP